MRACGCSVVGVPHVHVVGSDGCERWWAARQGRACRCSFAPKPHIHARGHYGYIGAYGDRENTCGVVELGETTGAGNTRWPLTTPPRMTEKEG